MAQGFSLIELLTQARSRVLRHLVLDKGALALVVGLGGAALLLLTGTAILDWYWPLLLAVVSLAIGVTEVRKHVPSVYELAQRIDRRLGLHDTLSTAIYFKEHPKSGWDAICAGQRDHAEQTSRTVDLEQALPMPRSKWLLPAGTLLLAVVGLFAVRFAVVGSLDLKPSLLAMAADTFFSTEVQENQELAAEQSMNLKGFEASQAAESGAEMDPDNPLKQEKGIAPAEAEADALTESEEGAGQSNDSSKQKGDKQGESPGDQQESQESQQGDQTPPKDGKQDKGKEGGESGQSSQNQEPSMMDKLRDALANMMNELTGEDKPQADQGKNPQQKQDQQKQAKGDKGGEPSDQPNKQDGEGQQQAEASQQDGKAGEAQQGKDSQNPGQPSDQAASGSGSNDGEKALEEAALLQAMGDVSELLMKRAENVSGEVMMEVGETKQTLRTELTEQQAGHREAGSQIHRDEIPRIHQQYVGKYFEEIHRPSPTPAASPANPANAGPMPIRIPGN